MNAIGTCRWNGYLFQPFWYAMGPNCSCFGMSMGPNFYLNGIPIYILPSSSIVSSVSSFLCDMHPGICPIVDTFYIQCIFFFLYLYNIVWVII